jgi:hypothetical protein
MADDAADKPVAAIVEAVRGAGVPLFVAPSASVQRTAGSAKLPATAKELERALAARSRQAADALAAAASADATVQAHDPRADAPTPALRPRVQMLELIERAVDGLGGAQPAATASSSSSSSSAEYPPIEAFCRRCGLNAEQRVAFVRIALALLQAVLRKMLDPEAPHQLPLSRDEELRHPAVMQELRKAAPTVPMDELLMYMGGAAGSGKSTVIKAVLEFARLWRVRDRVLVTATTGIAAVHVRGQTVHGAFGLGWGKARSGRGRAAGGVLSAAEAALCRAFLVVVDEVSMMDKALLANMSARLQTLRDKRDLPFGGVDLVLVGDFFQLPPVASTALYAPTKLNDAKTVAQCAGSKKAALVVAGDRLWAQLNAVVLLRQTVRQQSDAELAQLLAAVREGNVGAAQRERLNSRLVAKLPASDRPGPNALVVVPTNAQRAALNEAAVADAAASGVTVHKLVADLRIKGFRPSPDELRALVALNDTDLDGLPPVLFAFEGMRAMVTANVDVAAGVANGTQVVVERLVYAEGVAFTPLPCTLAGRSVTVSVPSAPPLYLLVRVLDAGLAAALQWPDDVLPAGTYPLKLHECSPTVRLPRRLKSVAVAVRQFACVPLYGVTGHKVQGQTCRDGLVVGSFTTPARDDGKRTASGIPSQWAYVVLSRVPSLHRLWLLEELSEATAQRTKPDARLLAEMRRLHALHERTVAQTNGTAVGTLASLVPPPPPPPQPPCAVVAPAVAQPPLPAPRAQQRAAARVPAAVPPVLAPAAVLPPAAAGAPVAAAPQREHCGPTMLRWPVRVDADVRRLPWRDNSCWMDAAQELLRELPLPEPRSCPELLPLWRYIRGTAPPDIDHRRALVDGVQRLRNQFRWGADSDSAAFVGELFAMCPEWRSMQTFVYSSHGGRVRTGTAFVTSPTPMSNARVAEALLSLVHRARGTAGPSDDADSAIQILQWPQLVLVTMSGGAVAMPADAPVLHNDLSAAYVFVGALVYREHHFTALLVGPPPILVDNRRQPPVLPYAACRPCDVLLQVFLHRSLVASS